MTTSSSFENLIKQTSVLIRTQKADEKQRGEKFNIFSILGVESRENKTHSAFICELLKPNGTHLQGDIFLKCFLETLEMTDFELTGAFAKCEHSIHKVNYDSQTGGRIDIYIKNSFGKTISIENKIYAGDMKLQIARYCNHNKGKNKVLYLTLMGDEPTKESSGDFRVGEDFEVISYKSDILNWLQLCLTRAEEKPILRESIRQYILLIKKLTNTMDKTYENELTNLLLDNFEEATFIANHLESARRSIGEELRQLIISGLEARLSKSYLVQPGNKATGTNVIHSQIWIKRMESLTRPFYFGIESFTGLGNLDGNLHIGIFISTGKWSKENEDDNEYWTRRHSFSPFQDSIPNLNDPKTIKLLNNDQEFKKGLVNHIVEESLKYIEEQSYFLISLNS